MNLGTTSIAALLFAAMSTLVARPAAAADGDDDAHGFNADVLVGYGDSIPVNVIGLGLGARAGYLSESGLYGGVLGLVHFGSTDPGEPDVRHRSESVRFELGYEIEIEPLALRPAFRAGFTHVTTSRSDDERFWSPDVGLGATLLVRLDGPLLGLDIDARYLTNVIEHGDTATVLVSVAGYWVFGYRF